MFQRARLAATALFAIAFSAFAPPVVRAQDGEELPPGLRRMLADSAKKHAQPAVAAATFTSDGLTDSAAWGLRSNAPDAKPVEPGDRFHVGSCTKAMTATLAAILVRDGVIRWESTLGESFPDLASMNDAYRTVTLEQLLHHRGGIPAFTVGNSDEFKLLRGLKGDARSQRRGLCEALLTRAPATPVGAFVYSNAGYAVAAAMLERAADKPYEDLMQQRVFNPLGMTSAGFGWPATKERSDQPLGHQPVGKGLMVHPIGFMYRIEPPLSPAGDAHMSIEDFARFARFHLGGLRGVPARGFDLTRDDFERLHAASAAQGPGSDYACGWAISKSTNAPTAVHWHNGSAGTFFAIMSIDPASDRGVVVATNAGSGEDAAEELTRALMSDPAGRPGQAAPPADR